jgi:hypothetical protein
VKIENHETAYVAVVWDMCARANSPALFVPADGKIHVRYVAELKTTQNRIAISTDPKAVLFVVSEVGQAQRRTQKFNLFVTTRARHPFGHLLEQHKVRLLMDEQLDDPLEPVAPVEPADPLMNIPGDEA